MNAPLTKTVVSLPAIPPLPGERAGVRADVCCPPTLSFYNLSFILYPFSRPRRAAFSLVELLVVISIIGLLAGLAVPAIKNLGKSNVTVSASRQMLDEIARARQLALSQHTTVYMLFVDASFWQTNVWFAPDGHPVPWPATTAVTNLCDKQLTGYNFVSLRSIGDQPGRSSTNYLAAGWQSLADGGFIPPWKFGPRATLTYFKDATGVRAYAIPGFSRTAFNPIPYPVLNSPVTALNLPYIAFNYLGQLTTEEQSPAPSPQDEYIPLAQGTVGPAMYPNSKTYQVGAAPSVTEVPPGNSTNATAYSVIHIDWLTGRARLEHFQVQ